MLTSAFRRFGRVAQGGGLGQTTLIYCVDLTRLQLRTRVRCTLCSSSASPIKAFQAYESPPASAAEGPKVGGRHTAKASDF